MNKVGTCGVGSAAYWWGRLAACLHRAALRILGVQYGPWALLFADDWDLSAGNLGFEVSLLGFVWVMVALGVPFSWRKGRGDFTYSWIGVEHDSSHWEL